MALGSETQTDLKHEIFCTIVNRVLNSQVEFFQGTRRQRSSFFRSSSRAATCIYLFFPVFRVMLPPAAM